MDRYQQRYSERRRQSDPWGDVSAVESELEHANSPHRRYAVALAVFLIPFLFSFSAAQVTAPGTGQRIQSQAANILLEVDSLMPNIYEQWREEALTTDQSSLAVPGLPLEVQVPTDDIVNSPIEDLQAQVIDEAGAQVYSDGFDVLADNDNAGASDISSAGLMRRGMGLISEGTHTIFKFIAIVTGIICAIFVGMILLVGRNLSRLFSIGGALLAAALPLLLLATFVRFILGKLAGGQDDVFAAALLRLGEDIMMIPIRNDIIFSVLGFALMVIALVFGKRQIIGEALPEQGQNY